MVAGKSNHLFLFKIKHFLQGRRFTGYRQLSWNHMLYVAPAHWSALMVRASCRPISRPIKTIYSATAAAHPSCRVVNLDFFMALRRIIASRSGGPAFTAAGDLLELYD
jgi:hypothetical protein